MRIKYKTILSFRVLSGILLISIFLPLLYGGCGNGGGGITPPPQPPPSSINLLNVEILDASVDADRQVNCTFRMVDENDNPLSLDDLDQINFIIARIVDSGEYIDYVTRDQEGATQVTCPPIIGP